MKKWEYMIMNLSQEEQKLLPGVQAYPYPENLNKLDAGLSDVLNKTGAEGWELVSSFISPGKNQVKLIFKRCVE